MSRNKDIKLLHEWTGWSYKECRKQMKDNHWNLCQAFNFEELISKLPDLLEDVSIAIAKVYEATADVVKSLKKALESIDADQLLSIYAKTSEVKENERGWPDRFDDIWNDVHLLNSNKEVTRYDDMLRNM